MSDGHVWYAAAVKSGRIGVGLRSDEDAATCGYQELRFERYMRKLFLPTLVPKFLDDGVINGKSAEIVKPLYAGYVFVGPRHWNDWQELKRTPGYLGLIRNRDGYITVPRRAMDDIRLASVPSKIEAERERNLSIGDRVIIRRGHFAELGAVIEAIEAGQATVRVPFLGSTRVATIPYDELHPG